MTNITSLPEYINLSKFATYNETITIASDYTFDSILSGIIGVLHTYTILQWTTSIIIFITLFMALRKMETSDFIQITNVQIVSLASFIVIAMNVLLLLFEYFSILQPLQLFFIIWLITTIISIITKR